MLPPQPGFDYLIEPDILESTTREFVVHPAQREPRFVFVHSKIRIEPPLNNHRLEPALLGPSPP